MTSFAEGMNFSLILHLGCGIGWLLTSAQTEKVIVVRENSNENGELVGRVKTTKKGKSKEGVMDVRGFYYIWNSGSDTTDFWNRNGH